jgi:hypothetical protein
MFSCAFLIYRISPAVITNNPQAPVPWGEVSESPAHYLDLECVPENTVVKDPSHMQKDTITAIYSHWKERARHDEPIVCFVGYRQADFYDSHGKKGGAAGKSRKKPDYVDVTSDEEQRLKKVDDGKSSSDEDEGIMDTIPIPDSCPNVISHISTLLFQTSESRSSPV